MKNFPPWINSIRFLSIQKKPCYGISCLILVLCCSLTAISKPTHNHEFYYQQNEVINIHGRVVDNNGKALQGATIKVKGTNTGAITDEKGTFSLQAENNSTLEITLVGYEKKEVAVNGKANITIILDPLAVGLNEVVVVGYGTQKKKDLTGSVSTLDFDKQKVVPMANTASMLEGRMSGVTVSSGGAQPGRDNPVIRIRGIGTLGNNDPMVIIDGIEGTVSQMSDIAPDDIESITVLKDAASAAIYGVRAANGVILVTTKRGSSGKVNVNYRGTYTLQQATVLPDYVNSWDWAQLYNESQGLPIYTPDMIQKMKDGSDPDHFANTNWVKQVFRTAPMQTHYLSLDGGNKMTKYRVSVGYLGQDGIMNGTNSNRINFRSNADFKVNNNIHVGVNLAGNRQRINEPFGGTGDGDGIMRTLYWFSRPTVPIKYSDGDWGSVDGNQKVVAIHNPLEWTSLDDQHENDYGFNGQVFATVSFLRNFQFKTIFAGKYDQGLQSGFNPLKTYYDADGNIVLQDATNSLTNWNNYHSGYESENTLTYNANYGNHNITALIGYSAQYDRYGQNSASIQNFPNNQLQQLSAGTNFPAVTGTATEVALQSIFGRINYNYADKYLLEFNLRRDGSSRMPPSDRFGVFPSVSAGWRISEENFMKDISYVSNLKIRGSWGKLGNQEIGNYAYDQLVSLGQNYVVNGQLQPGAAITSLANTGIKWESTAITDIGLDLGLFNEKIDITADYFDKITSGILLRLPIPLTLGGVGAPYQNAGKVGNKGWEFSIRYNNHFTNGNYSLSANISHVKNEVLDLKGQKIFAGSGIDSVGYPIGAFYGYEAIGIYQDSAQIQNGPKRFNGIAGPGDIIYMDISGPNGKPDGQVDATYDRTILGSPFPKFTYGFSGSVSYKNFDLALFFQGISGIKRFYFEPIGGNGNLTSRWLGRFTTQNPSETMPRLHGISNQENSTFWLTDAAYLRLKNIQLGYNLPIKVLQRAGVTNCRIYLSGTNLLTFSKVKNWDPEKFASDATNYNYPEIKTYAVNINFNF